MKSLRMTQGAAAADNMVDGIAYNSASLLTLIRRRPACVNRTKLFSMQPCRPAGDSCRPLCVGAVGAAMLPALAGAREWPPPRRPLRGCGLSSSTNSPSRICRRRMTSGKFTCSLPDPEIYRSDRSDRPARAGGQQRDRTQSRRPGHRRAPRQGAQRPKARAARCTAFPS